MGGIPHRKATAFACGTDTAIQASHAQIGGFSKQFEAKNSEKHAPKCEISKAQWRAYKKIVQFVVNARFLSFELPDPQTPWPAPAAMVFF